MSLSIAGFEGRDELARALARELGATYISLVARRYRAGESVIRVLRPVGKRCLLVADVEADGESIWRVLLAADALRRAGAKRVSLFAPWMAYGRQDRLAARRESVGGAAFGPVLSRAFYRIYTLDAHSRMFRRFFRGRLKSLSASELAIPVARLRGATAIGAPDRGAVPRAREVARKMRLPFIRCEKIRGRSGVRVSVFSGDPKDRRVVLIDDMVDSGGTLAAAAEALRRAGARSVGAAVTHAADPASVPRAQSLGLDYLKILYQRNKKFGWKLEAKLLGAFMLRSMKV